MSLTFHFGAPCGAMQFDPHFMGFTMNFQDPPHLSAENFQRIMLILSGSSMGDLNLSWDLSKVPYRIKDWALFIIHSNGQMVTTPTLIFMVIFDLLFFVTRVMPRTTCNNVLWSLFILLCLITYSSLNGARILTPSK